MPSDPPEISATLPQRAGAASSALVLLVAAFAGTVALVWGYETRACDGVIAGALAAMMRAGFLALVHLPELLKLLMIFFAHLGVAYLAARRPPFHKREELLTIVLPVIGFLLGWLVADMAWFEGRCALHPWR